MTLDARILVIQAKRHARDNLITGPDLQRFGGTCYNVHRAQVAAVVTTSAFAKQAREHAAAMRIVLFDHDALGDGSRGTVRRPRLMVPPPASFVLSADAPQGKHSRPAGGHKLPGTHGLQTADDAVLTWTDIRDTGRFA